MNLVPFLLDVVFDRRLIPHLINVVLKSLKRKGKAIFASTIRNVDTYNYFLHKLGSVLYGICFSLCKKYEEKVLTKFTSLKT